jgi:hypothetical protein
MDAGKEVAAVAVYEALLAMYGADWIVEQVGDELRGELAILGLIEEDTVSEASENDREEESDANDASQEDDSVGEAMDEE